MKLTAILVTVLALSLLAGIAMAAGNGGGKARKQRVNGEILKIDGANITIHPQAPKNATEQPPDVVVETNDATTVTVNGEKKTVADLKVAQKVRVLLAAEGKTAISIDVGKKPKANTPNTDKPKDNAPATQPAK